LFHYNSTTDEDGNPIVINFKPELLVDKSLSKADLAPVLKHERVHEADFQRLAGQLKKSLEAAYKKGDVDLGPWLEWFDYDYLEARTLISPPSWGRVGADFDPNFPPARRDPSRLHDR
jgi:hypothetical protein